MSDETGIDEETDVEVGNNLPTPEVIGRMLKEYKLSKADMDEHRGKIGALVQDGENTHNVHRKAFKLLTQVENMDDTKRSEFLFHFINYLGMMDLAPHPDLFADQRAADIAEIAQKDARVLEEAEAVH